MQQVTTLLRVVEGFFGPTMLHPFTGLHGPKSLTRFKLYATTEVPTSANIVVVPCNYDGRNMLGLTMLRVVGQ